MSRRVSLLLMLTALLGLVLFAVAPALGSGVVDTVRQTWPSRTPTSGAPQPTSPSGTEPPPGATSIPTSQPGSTPQTTIQPPPPTSVAGQATGGPSLSGTRVPGGQGENVVPGALDSIELPSAREIGDCGLPPLAVAMGSVNVRSGPGIDYATVAQLAFQDERPIVGRAATSAWWQILLAGKQLGWVSDQAVTVVGFTGAVPVTAEDQGDGSQSLWNPTPNPACTPPSQEEISISDGQLTALMTQRQPAEADSEPTTSTNAAAEEDSARSPDTSPLPPIADDTESNLIWLPILGGLLVIAGAIAFVFQRRQS